MKKLNRRKLTYIRRCFLKGGDQVDQHKTVYDSGYCGRQSEATRMKYDLSQSDKKFCLFFSTGEQRL